MVFASRSKRIFSCAFSANSAGSTLMATLRSSRVSRALKTSPIPPAPRGARTSYGPSRVPAEIGIGSVCELYVLFAAVEAANPCGLIGGEGTAGGACRLDLLRIALAEENRGGRIAGQKAAGDRGEHWLAVLCE